MSIDKINDLSLHNSAIAKALHSAAGRVIDSGWYAMGPEVTAFEKAFAAYCGATDAIGVANGTDAIELALRAVGVSAGDEVITVANAGFYSSTAIRAIGAVPVYVDIQESNLLMDVACAAKVITSKTKAIIITHLWSVSRYATFMCFSEKTRSCAGGRLRAVAWRYSQRKKSGQFRRYCSL